MTANELKRVYEEAMAAQLAKREAEAARENAAKRAEFEQAEAALFAVIAPHIPEGVLVEWKLDQCEPRKWLGGYFMVDGEDRRYLVEFIARQLDDGSPQARIKLGDSWKEVVLSRLAEYIGAEITYQDMLRAEETQRMADRAAYAAEEEKRGAEYRAEQAAARTQAAADKAAAAARKEAKRAASLARRVAEAEAIAAAQAKHLVNPSGFLAEDLDRWAQAALDTAQDAGARLPQVEQLRAEISIFERQLKEAQAAATWGITGGNETERKNLAARALAADPQVKQIQAALDDMARRLAVIEPEYKAVAMKSGAWRAVCELYAGWLQSLR